MILYRVTISAWVLEILLIGALAWLLRGKWTLFRAFINADLLRSVLVFLVWNFAKSPNTYGLTFILTSVPVLLALGLAALEAGREMNDKWHPYIMIAAIFMMFLFPRAAC